MASQSQSTYMLLRQAAGIVGFALPLLLPLAAHLSAGVRANSISEYYATPAREVLTGSLIAIAFFLVCHKGHPQGGTRDPRFSDHHLSIAAGIGALGVALVPINDDPVSALRALIAGPSRNWLAEGVHSLSALLFFASVGWMAFDNFRLGDATDPVTKGKNQVFRAAAIVIFAVTAALCVVAFQRKITGIEGWPTIWPAIVFWLEALGVWAFAIAWLVKGEVAGETGREVMRKLAGSQG